MTNDNNSEFEEKSKKYIEQRIPDPTPDSKRRIKTQDIKDVNLKGHEVVTHNSNIEDLDEFEIILDAVTGKLIGWNYPSMVIGGGSEIYSVEETQKIVEKYIEIPKDAKFDSLIGQTINKAEILGAIWNHYYKDKLIENDSIFVRFNPTTKKVISVRKYWYEED